MANKFKVFGNSTNNKVSDSNWTEDATPTLKNGFLSGTAISSSIMNTILRQNSLLTYSLVDVLNSYSTKTINITPSLDSASMIDFVKDGLLGVVGFNGTYTANTTNGDRVSIQCGGKSLTFNVTNAKNAANATNATTATKSNSITTSPTIDTSNPYGLYACVVQTPDNDNLSFLLFIVSGNEYTNIGVAANINENRFISGWHGTAHMTSAGKVSCELGFYDASTGKCTQKVTKDATTVRKITLAS